MYIIHPFPSSPQMWVVTHVYRSRLGLHTSYACATAIWWSCTVPKVHTSYCFLLASCSNNSELDSQACLAHPILSEAFYDPIKEVVMGSDFWEDRVKLNTLYNSVTLEKIDARESRTLLRSSYNSFIQSRKWSNLQQRCAGNQSATAKHQGV